MARTEDLPAGLAPARFEGSVQRLPLVLPREELLLIAIAADERQLHRESIDVDGGISLPREREAIVTS